MTRSQRVLAIGLVLGVTLVAFETTAVITALPTITDDLGGDSLYGVTLAAYTLANLVALVAAGELADRHGPAKPYFFSILVFIGGLVVAAAAPTMAVVVLGRVLQGAGSGAFGTIAYLLIKRAFPDESQARMYAIVSAGWVLPSLLAPAIAGTITDHLGWRWVFLTIIPLAMLVGGLALRPMAAFGRSGVADGTPSRIPFALGAALGIGALVTGLQFANPIAAVTSSVVGVIAAVHFLRRLFPTGVGRARRGFPAIVSCRMLATATFLGVDSFVPLAADRIHGASARVQGFVIIGSACTWTLGQWFMARHPNISPRRGVFTGFALLLTGIVLVSPVLHEGWPLWATFLSWSVGGLGMGLLFNPTTVAAMSYAEPGREGLVGGQVSLADAVGFSLMGGVGGAMVALADRTSLNLTTALATNFTIAAVLACVGMVASRGVQRAGVGSPAAAAVIGAPAV
ncbi:MAG: MFS transporter [Ilumatobacteraceae bacterium]